MRFAVTLIALAFSMPGWSAELTACSNADAAALLTKFRQHISPAPESPQHRWIVSKSDGSDHWMITEYSGLRVFIRCRPMTRADELNAIHEGVIEFRYEARRTTGWPELTSAGLQWNEWTEWVDAPKPAGKDLRAAGGLFVVLVEGAEARRRQIDFRKYQGKLQFEWEYTDSQRITLMPAVEVTRYLSTADAEAAALRSAEAERTRLEQEEADRKREQERLEAEQDARNYQAFRSRLKGAPDMSTFYPPASRRREEQGTVKVRICVDPDGRVSDTRVADTSGFPDLDNAALRAAGQFRFKPSRDKKAVQDLCSALSMRFSLDN